MKTTFSRLFILFATIILLCLLVLGMIFRVMLFDYLKEEKQQTLHSNAVSMTKLAAAYDAAGELDERWGNFRIALTAAARVSGNEAMLCGPDGEIWMCSCRTVGCSHVSSVVDRKLVEQVLAQEEYFTESTLSGIYEVPYFVEGMAVRSLVTDRVIAILFVTSSPEQITGMLRESISIFMYVAAAVLLLAMAASFLMSRSQARSLQAVTGAAARFGHGDLDARVPVNPKATAEMTALTEAFNSMAESISQSERQRQEFVANISHELRTPMTTISGFVDGMLDDTIPAQQHRQYMQLVSDEVRRLSRLVRSMLEVSRLRSQGISEEKKRRFDLCESVGQVLISFEQRVNRKAIHMDVQMPDRSIWVKADPDSITQVLYNLTDNAVKFCTEGGLLGISLETEGQKARVTVRNTGPTIPPEELPLLFDRFHKTDKSRSADKEGVGLGLYIVKTILDGHGESIRVTSENGLTVFTFTLPLAR
jgi:signal transduction histidine kinase